MDLMELGVFRFLQLFLSPNPDLYFSTSLLLTCVEFLCLHDVSLFTTWEVLDYVYLLGVCYSQLRSFDTSDGKSWGRIHLNAPLWSFIYVFLFVYTHFPPISLSLSGVFL